MSKKIWNVKFVAGNPDIFSEVKMASGSPFTRAAADEAFSNLTRKGWRAWMEHAETGERITESNVEKAFQLQISEGA